MGVPLERDIGLDRGFQKNHGLEGSTPPLPLPPLLSPPYMLCNRRNPASLNIITLASDVKIRCQNILKSGNSKRSKSGESPLLSYLPL